MDQGPKDQNKLAANHFKASTSYPLLGNPWANGREVTQGVACGRDVEALN